MAERLYPRGALHILPSTLGSGFGARRPGLLFASFSPLDSDAETGSGTVDSLTSFSLVTTPVSE